MVDADVGVFEQASNVIDVTLICVPRPGSGARIRGSVGEVLSGYG